MSLTGNTPCEGGQDRCLGRSRGGLTTKIHALVDKKGRPIKLKLTAGQASDVASAPELIADLPKDAILIADKELRRQRVARGGGRTRRMGEHPAQSQSQGSDLLQQISL